MLGLEKSKAIAARGPVRPYTLLPHSCILLCPKLLFSTRPLRDPCGKEAKQSIRMFLAGQMVL